MLNTRKKKITILSVLAISILILGLFQNIKIAFAQTFEETLILDQNFQIDEYSENKGEMKNVTSIDIDLGSSRWNATDIQLNFTNIKQERELKTIEDIPTNWLTMDKFSRLAAVQIDITETTEIYSVQIYGSAVDPPLNPVYIKINGYDDALEEPNDTNYGIVEINISSSADWYTQEFDGPVKLSPGNYSLIMDATAIGLAPQPTYRWFLNDSNPKYPDLYTWHSSGDNWDPGQKGQTLLYKLYQKTNKTYFPDDIDMAVEVNGSNYEVQNGPEIGKGGVIIPNLNYHVADDNLHIPIKTNAHLELNFTMNYTINLYNHFLTDGAVIINTNQKIEWNVNFYLERSNGNYTVRFYYPNSWTNFSVLKNDNPLVHGLDYFNNTVEKTITIFNNTISSDSLPWKITAESLNIPINFNGPDAQIIAGSEAISGVDFPLNGNYTYILYAGSFEKYRNSTLYSGGTLTFSYIIPSTGPNGDWTAVIYWNNGTDAGVESSDFIVSGGVTIISDGGGGGGGGGGTTVSGLDPMLVTIVTIIIIASLVAALASYQTVKSVKKKRDLELKKLHSKFIDILSLNYLLVVDKKTGLNVYEQFFAGKSIDASLITGFLEAIRNFGIELTGTYTQSQTIKLEYQDSKILMAEFKDFRIVVVMTENPSEDFLNSITALSYDIEKNFGQMIREFKGDTTPFRAINKLVENNFNISFIAPLTIGDIEHMKLSDAEISMVNKAKSIMKQNNLNFFFTSFLLPEQTYDPKKTRTVFDLIEKKIFIPTKIA